MNGEVVALPQELIEAHRGDAQRVGAVFVYHRVVGDHMDTEAGHFLRDQPWNASKAHQAQGFPLHTVQGFDRGVAAVALFDLTGQVSELFRTVQQKRNGVVGDLVNAVVRNVADIDAALLCRSYVNIVHADGVTDNHLAFVQRRNNLAGDGGKLADQRIAARCRGDDFIFRFALKVEKLCADFCHNGFFLVDAFIVIIGNDDFWFVHSVLLVVFRLQNLSFI